MDNAGIRKMQKIKENTESAAVIRAENEMRQSDVIIFVIDISKRVDQNDLLIAQKVVKAAKPVIIAGNKADLLSRRIPPATSFSPRLRDRFNALYFAPFIPVSAKTGKNIFQMLDLAESINAKLDKKIQIDPRSTSWSKRLLREKKLTTSDHRIFSPKYISIESQRAFFRQVPLQDQLETQARRRNVPEKKIEPGAAIRRNPHFFQDFSLP